MTPARDVDPAPREPTSEPAVVPAVTDPDGSTVRIRDAGTLRALANPLRLRILGELRRGGPATVGALARTTGTAVGSVSFHLRTLAEHGFVTEVPELARDRRERWWRATAASTSWTTAQFQGTDDDRAALAELERTVLRGQLAMAEEALDQRHEIAPEWVEAGYYGDDRLELTLPEAEQLKAELGDVLERWVGRARESGRPETAGRTGTGSGETAPVILVLHSYRGAR